MPENLKEEFAHAKGNLLLKQGRYEEAIPQIRSGMKRYGATNLDKAREHYLLGQLYTLTGDYKAAYKSFDKTISKNPPYELEFNARIRQTESATDENQKKILRKLKRMAKSPKNEEYLSQIYYAIGNIHMNSKDTTEAIKAYETGVAEGSTSGYGTGMIHLSLANIYWEREKFSKAYENYGKAIAIINENTDGYVYNAHYNSIYGLKLVAKRKARTRASRYKHDFAYTGTHAVYSDHIFIRFYVVFYNFHFKKFASRKRFLLFRGNNVSNNKSF